MRDRRSRITQTLHPGYHRHNHRHDAAHHIRKPDDWHLHVRDGAMLEAVLPYTAKNFGRHPDAQLVPR